MINALLQHNVTVSTRTFATIDAQTVVHPAWSVVVCVMIAPDAVIRLDISTARCEYE